MSSWGQVPPTNDTSGGSQNTGGGSGALDNLTTGAANTAYGNAALSGNTSGGTNAAVGASALEGNTTGDENTAVGAAALGNNTTGIRNVAVGAFALLSNSAGSNNIAIGRRAGTKLASGSQNIYLEHLGPASNTESQTMRLGQTQTRTFIAGIVTSPLMGSPVVITNKGRLGIVASSARYKRDIRRMGQRSQGLYQLRPVTFRYKQDAQGQRQYGLIAEEVAQVYPELVTKGADGKVESVQYHELIPMLLNEVQDQQRELVELKAQNARLEAALAQQQAQNAAVAARLEQLEQGTLPTAALVKR